MGMVRKGIGRRVSLLEMGGSISGGVAVYDGDNGIMAFGTNLLGPRSVPLRNFYIDSCL
jgi:hypothetical protein